MQRTSKAKNKFSDKKLRDKEYTVWKKNVSSIFKTVKLKKKKK